MYKMLTRYYNTMFARAQIRCCVSMMATVHGTVFIVAITGVKPVDLLVEHKSYMSICHDVDFKTTKKQ